MIKFLLLILFKIRVGSGLAMIKNAKIEDIGKRKPETRKAENNIIYQ